MKRRMQAGHLETYFDVLRNNRDRKQLRRYASTLLQSFWRGEYSRRCTEDFYYMKTWAILFIQTAWRGRSGRAMAWSIQRKIFLRDFNKREKEMDNMFWAEGETRTFSKELSLVVLIQRSWRGVQARDLFREMKRIKYLNEIAQKKTKNEVGLYITIIVFELISMFIGNSGGISTKKTSRKGRKTKEGSCID